MRKILLGIAVVVALFSVSVSFKAKPAECSSTQFTVRISGHNLPDSMNVDITLPQGYYNDADSTRYPVVYLLHGHGGNNTTWGRLVNLDSLASHYGMIFVCPDGKASWYWDAPARPHIKMESFITGELIRFVDSHYRTKADRHYRAITGLSMGGHGGLWLGIRHSDLFGTAGATSGGVDIRPWPDGWNMSESLGAYAENKAIWDSHTVASIVKDLKPGQLNIIFDCGTEDFFYGVNCALDSALNVSKIPHIFRTSPGAHNGTYWSKSILFQLQYFNDVFTGY